MLRINQLKLPVGHQWENLVKKVNKILRINEEVNIQIVRRSLDARKKPELYFNYVLDICVKNEAAVYKKCDKKQVVIYQEKEYCFPVMKRSSSVRPVIIGTGPAGLFCGYMLAEAGFKPILLERGMDMEARMAEVNKFWNTGILNTESNVQFGEGGAGTFSDGKLNTLVKDTYGRNKKVLSLFVKEGAPEQILYDHKPHIGTDILSRIVVNMRNTIISNGGEIHFSSKVTGFEIENNQIRGVLINETKSLPAECVVLAPGHSARDTFEYLFKKGVLMEAKSFAVGLRVEHPQELINLSQYGVSSHKELGSAAYKLTASAVTGSELNEKNETSIKRGVYSFCMCPGGYVVNASSEQEKLCVNGMSFSERNERNANSAVIITVTPEDYGSNHPLAGVEFQRRLEMKAYKIGNGRIPVERFGEFQKAVSIQASDSGELPIDDEINALIKSSVIDSGFEPCIKGNWEFAPVHEIMPAELNRAFVEGMNQFGKIIRGFNDNNVLVEGIESRTSSPLKILRDESLQSNIRGLYPCGEGAGYAGGITSAAMDGIKTAEVIADALNRKEG